MPVISATPDLDALTLTLVAEFAAPVQRIWDLYADPRQLEKVWGPPTHPATFVDHQLGVGARCTYFMTGPGGEKYCGYWIVTLVDAPVRLCFDDGFADEAFNPIVDMPLGKNEYRFEPVDLATGPGTRATYVATYASREALEKILAMGSIEGATAAINQIDALLAG